MTEPANFSITPRELDVLRLMCAGLVNKEIARSLGLHLRTVEIHRANLLRRTGCNNACQLGVWAARAGVVDANTNTTRAAGEAHSSDRVSPITKAAALPSAPGTPRGA
jgi:DNA-binding CsgD family transcriptional regulator